MHMRNNRVGPYPAGVDPAKRESYLSDEEFESVLKMSRADFDRLATWKKNKAKRNAGLFWSIHWGYFFIDDIYNL